jgi:hypothetical protein
MSGGTGGIQQLKQPVGVNRPVLSSDTFNIKCCYYICNVQQCSGIQLDCLRPPLGKKLSEKGRLTTYILHTCPVALCFYAL